MPHAEQVIGVCRVLCGDALEVLATLPDCSIDAIVTDPPYGLKFMGKKWDSFGGELSYTAWCAEFGTQGLRVLKPGGHLIAFGGTRTHHRLMCALEDAWFEIRDTLMWLYASGFPKSLNVGKALDKMAGAEREVLAPSPFASRRPHPRLPGSSIFNDDSHVEPAGGIPFSTPATDAAQQWNGWGTALKPAWEIIVLARKPLSEPTVAANVLKWGTGALNIDGCRIEGDMSNAHFGGCQGTSSPTFGQVRGKGYQTQQHAAGRWPSNVVLTYDENTYTLCEDVTSDQLRQLAEWIDEDAKL